MSQQLQDALEPGSRVPKPISYIATVFAAFGTMLVLFLLAAINLDIISRFLFNRPIAGIAELVELSIVAVVFFQLPHAIRTGGLVRSGELQARLGKSRPKIAHIMSCLYEIIGSLFFGAIAAVIFPRMVTAFKSGHFVGNPGIFTVPYWPLLLIIFLGSIVAATICAYSCVHRFFGEVTVQD